MHRDEEKGPAAVYGNGIQEWIVNGVLHRDNGPAITSLGGSQSYYKNGIKMDYCIVIMVLLLSLLLEIKNGGCMELYMVLLVIFITECMTGLLAFCGNEKE